jgi:hypothetical protein
MKSVVVLVLFMLFALGLLLLGQYARQVVLDSNACEMTYSMKEKEEIYVGDHHGNMRLFRYHTEYKEGVKNKLLPQPVLFVGGHRGE